jgi:class 3 adenylate cyclase
MQCVQCQHDNASDAKFCNQCAAPFAPVCSACGHENPANAKFCHQCGAALRSTASAASSVQPMLPEAEAERRFHVLLRAVMELLQRERRVTYRALKHVFVLNDPLVAEIRDELTFKQFARDEAGKGLVWMGEAPPVVPREAVTPRAPATADTPAVVASPVISILPPPVTETRTPSIGPTGPTEAITPEALQDEPITTPELTRSAPQAERRQLTVMFCDLADSTTLSHQLDPEDLREVVRAYQTTAAEVIQQYDGHLAQYLGDGLLIYFGWPIAHEDDAQRAAYAGLGIVKAITTTLNPRLEREKGVQLTVRLGVHTGPVVVGEMGGGGRHENLASGETVNVAARLEGLAAPNTVLISSVTARLAEKAFVLEALGPQMLKGVADPMDVFRVLDAVQVQVDETASVGAPFLVGRDEEVGLLLRRWEQSKEGLGQVVFIRGEAGIGKSSLVATLAIM